MGYDVDCIPYLVTPEFLYCDLNKEDGRRLKYSMMRKLDSIAIPDINLKTGKVYQVEDISNIVMTRGPVFLFTFTAKVKNDDSATCDTFIATIIHTTKSSMSACSSLVAMLLADVPPPLNPESDRESTIPLSPRPSVSAQ
ncbi:hypothetical protein OROHE_014581 [Orobanche hederae]